MANAIMIGISAIFSIPLLESFFPPLIEASTTVWVSYGISQVGQNTMKGGPIPNIGLFDVDGNRVGFMSGVQGGGEEAGGLAMIVVNPIDPVNSTPPEYLSLSASTDEAVCISHIAVTSPGHAFWTWNGNFGKQCGAQWYPSNRLMEGTDIRPACIWFSTDDTYPGGVGLHLPDFASATSSEGNAQGEQYFDHPNTLCKSKPRQTFYQNLTELNCIPVFNKPPDVGALGGDANFAQVLVDGVVKCTPGPDVEVPWQDIVRLRQFSSSHPSHPTYGVPGKRSLLPNQRLRTSSTCMDHHVVMSDIEAHSAREVCESTTSVGPDFVSTSENLYCDMCTHTLWPLCSNTTLSTCFNMKTKMMQPGKGLLLLDETGRRIPVKNFTVTTHWP